jgi:hypothetical protein
VDSGPVVHLRVPRGPSRVHSPVGGGTVAVPASGVLCRSLARVRRVDSSTSCPQRCAQVGEISPRPLTRRHDRPEMPTAPSTPGDPRPCGPDLLVSPIGGRWPPSARRRAPGPGYGLGTDPGGSRGQDVERRRPVWGTVEMSTCRHGSPPHRPQSANMSTRALTCADGLDPQDPHQ